MSVSLQKKLQEFTKCQEKLILQRQRVDETKSKIEKELTSKKRTRTAGSDFKKLLDRLKESNEKAIELYNEQRKHLQEYRVAFVKNLQKQLVENKFEENEENILSDLSKYPYLGLPAKAQEADFDDSLKWEHINKGVVLGEGSFGVVYKAICNGTEVAVKELKDKGENVTKALTAEASSLKELTHENILRFLGFVQPSDGKPAALVTEYASRMSLDKILFPEKDNTRTKDNTGKRIKFTFRRKMIIANEIANGMLFLHKKNFVHLDLKTANILVDEDFHIRIADFGLSRVVTVNFINAASNVVAGTPVYMAPELFEPNVSSPGNPKQCDVYSFGVVLWELVTERDPKKYYDRILVEKKQELAKDITEFGNYIKNGTLWLPIEEKDFLPEPVTAENKEKKPLIPTFAKTLKRVLKSCLQKDPDKRCYKKELSKEKATPKEKESHKEKAVHKPDESCFTELCDSENNVWHQSATDLVASGYQLVQEFWSNLTREEQTKEVPWKIFKREFAAFIKRSSDVKRMKLQFKALHALLGVQKTGDKEQFVTEEEFNRFLNWFPLQDQDKDKIVDNVYDLVTKPWWFGDITEQTATAYLKNAESGTFLIRYSSSYLGKFVLSYVIEEQVSSKDKKGKSTPEKVVYHRRFTLDPTDPIYTLGGKKMEIKNKLSIVSAVKEITKNSYLFKSTATPCPNQPPEFAALRVKVEVKKPEKKGQKAESAYAYVDEDNVKELTVKNDAGLVAKKDHEIDSGNVDKNVQVSSTFNFEYID